MIQKLHRPPPFLTEVEIDLLLNSHVATPAYIDLQHSHSPKHVSETSSVTENENLSLNHDSHGTLEEVSKPIYDDDFLPDDHLCQVKLMLINATINYQSRRFVNLRGVSTGNAGQGYTSLC